MWNEVYAPKCDADLAWSREKKRALLGRVRDVCDGTQPPSIHLLYGPTGCGKLSALRVLFVAAVRAGRDTDPQSALCVFHTCDATTLSYRQFLHHVLLHLSTAAVEAALPLRSGPPATAAHPAPPSSSAKADDVDGSTDENGPRAFVVKFYGEAASDYMQQRCTADFVARYEALRAVALRSGHRDAAAAQSLLQRLRQCFVFFIHTTHDTHDDKVDLAASFPAAVLGSAALMTFHCTPITQLNMRRRICQVVACEAQRRGLPGLPPCASTAASPSKSRAHHARATCGTRRSASRGADTTAGRRPPLLSDADLDVLVASSQGDLRQALLQAQWTMLLPLSASPPRCHKDTDSAMADDRDAVRRLLRAARERRARGGTRDALMPHSAMLAPADVTQGAADDDDDDGEEVVFVAARAAPPRQTSAKRPRTMLDLVDEAETRATSRTREASASAAAAALPTTRLAVTAVRDEYVGLAHATARLLTQKHSLSSVLDVLNVSPHKLLGYLMNNLHNYFDDQQIASYASCAAAGSAADAMRARESFATTYSDGSAASSRTRAGVTGDGAAAVRTSDLGPTPASPRQLQVMSLWLFDLTYRTAQTAVRIPRTFAAQRPPPLQRCAYPRTRALPRQRRTSEEAAVVHAIAAVPAPPTVDETAWRTPYWSELDWHRGFLTRLRIRDESREAGHKTLHAAVDEMYLSGLTGEEADIVREGLPSLVDRCGALDAIVLDYAPFARRIVLQQPQSDMGTQRGIGTAVRSVSPCPPSAGVASAAAATVGAPNAGARRTTFRLAPPATLPRDAQTTPRRLCGELQYRILACGLPQIAARLREDSFELSAMTEEERQSRLCRDDVCAAGSHSGTSPLSERWRSEVDAVEEIEECSD